MKNFSLLILTILLIQSCISSQTILTLPPSQSMSVTGLGQGQDAAYNPYGNGKSIAIIKNVSKNKFQVRIQKEGKVIKTTDVNAKEEKEFLLLEGYELYLDSELISKGQVTFKQSL